MKIPMSVLITVYVVAAFATFGWVFNTTPPDNRCYVNDKGEQYDCFETMARSLSAVLSGGGWPIYWAGTLSIKYVKP